MGVAVCRPARGDSQAVAMAVEGDDRRDLPMLPAAASDDEEDSLSAALQHLHPQHTPLSHIHISLRQISFIFGKIFISRWITGDRTANTDNKVLVNHITLSFILYIGLNDLAACGPHQKRWWRWWVRLRKRDSAMQWESITEKETVGSDCSCPLYFIFFYKLHCLPWPDEYLIGICCFICMLYNLGPYNRNSGREAAVPAVLSPTLSVLP